MISFKNSLHFLYIIPLIFCIFVFIFQVCRNTAVLIRWQIQFYQNTVFSNFANLAVRNKNFSIFAKNIPKIVVSRNNKTANSSRLQFKYNINDMPEFSTIYYIYYFLTPKLQKRRFQSIPLKYLITQYTLVFFKKYHVTKYYMNISKLKLPHKKTFFLQT